MRRMAKWGLAALTATAVLQPSAGFATCQALGVPSYFLRTDTAEWDRIFANKQAQKVVGAMIIGPCNVTDDETDTCVMPNDGVYQEYVEYFNKAKNFGIEGLGYVFTNYAARPIADVKAEIDRYVLRYKPDGIFLDSVKTDTPQAFTYYEDLYKYVKSKYKLTVTLNPGTPLFPETFMRISDKIINFEGTYNRYINHWRPPNWITKYPATRFWHLIHTTPHNAAAMKIVIQRSQSRTVGTVYATSKKAIRPGKVVNTWGSLPEYWESQVRTAAANCTP